MPIVLAMMKHETNTFSPVPTDLARFGHSQPTPFTGAEAIVKEVIEYADSGVCTSDCSSLDFKHVRRPIYPLDLINDPNPAGQ